MPRVERFEAGRAQENALSFVFAQFLTGLAGASSLFLVASGLSIIFGVSRIVNFAHGAFAMLGAYLAYTLTERFSGPFGFWGSILAASLGTALVGALVEMTLLRRLYRAPELFQLLATFGLTLVFEDLVVIVWGPDDLLGPRAPGLAGAVQIFGQAVPTYDLLLIAFGPIAFGLLWLLFHRSRFGVLVRAATQDREMVAALGVDQRWLFTAVFTLGSLHGGFRRRRADPARCRQPRHRPAAHRGRLRRCGDRRPGQRRRRLPGLDPGVGARRLRHPGVSRRVAGAGLRRHGAGAGCAALRPARAAPGAGPRRAGARPPALDAPVAAGPLRRGGPRRWLWPPCRCGAATIS